MSRRFWVTAAVLAAVVALAGCGSSKPVSAQPPSAPASSGTAGSSAATPSAGASPPATAVGSPLSTAPSSAQAASQVGVQDVSFVSADQGWALGGGELLTTTDGGASWSRQSAPPGGAAHIRFASAETGYAWSTDGSLWATTNGGASWRPGGLTQVISVETAAGWVWSLAGPQPYPTIWRAPVGSTDWTKLGLTPDRSATLTVHGDVAYVVGQQGAGPIAPSLDVFTGTAPVHHESLPCGQGQTYVPFVALGVSTDGTAYLVCDVMNNQTSQSTQTQLAFDSGNAGGSWSAASPPPPQPPQGVTAVAGAKFAWNAGPDLYRLTGNSWQISLTGPAQGFSLVGFETDTQGVALGANGYLWMTHNAGASWTRVPV